MHLLLLQLTEYIMNAPAIRTAGAAAVALLLLLL
jgi:hypothetical protein